MMMMMSVYVCMSEYSIYAFIYNEDNYTIGNKKKDFNDNLELHRVSSAIGNTSRDHMTKKSTCRER